MLERNFSRAREFVPERWLDGSVNPDYASLPFGSGARACIGRRIAEMSLTVLLARVGEKRVTAKSLAAKATTSGFGGF